MSLNSALDVQSIASLAQQQQQDEQNAAHDSVNANGTKRKAEDQGGQPRARRNRYVSIAWYVRICACYDGPWDTLPKTDMADGRTVTSASGARSSAMARIRASDAAT